MARKYKVHMLKGGGTPKDVEVIAQNQAEAKATAEAQNPGYKAGTPKDIGRA